MSAVCASGRPPEDTLVRAPTQVVGPSGCGPYICGVLFAPPAVSRRADERALFARHRRDPDPALREALVARYLPLARQVAARYGRTDEVYDDVFQVAALALVKAVDRYDPERGVAFASYAVPTVVGEVKRHFRDRTWAVHVSRDLQERSLRVGRAVTELTARLGRSPTVDEIAAYVDASTDSVLEALAAAGAYRAASLEAPRAHGGKPGVPLAESLGYDDERFAAVERRADLSSLVARLGPRDRAALWLRFEYDVPPARIATLLGVREREASRVVRRAVERLRRLVVDGQAGGARVGAGGTPERASQRPSKGKAARQATSS